MQMREYLERHGVTLQAIHEKSGISYVTCLKAKRGEPIKLWDVAKALSDATGGVVAPHELCSPEPPPKRRRRKPTSL